MKRKLETTESAEVKKETNESESDNKKHIIDKKERVSIKISLPSPKAFLML